jgi:uncharacterized lipoprotein YehR (DUF1307 family)
MSQEFPPAGGVPPEQKKSSPLKTVLIALAIIFVVAVGGCVACGVLIAKRASTELAANGLSLDDMRKDPQVTLLKITRIALEKSEGVEVVGLDETAKTLTIRFKGLDKELTYFFEGEQLKVKDETGKVFDPAAIEDEVQKALKQADEAQKQAAPGGQTAPAAGGN